MTVRFWAGAQRAAGHEYEEIEAVDVDHLRAALGARPELSAVCARASFLVDGQQPGTGGVLIDGQTVDVLPPFAGG